MSTCQADTHKKITAWVQYPTEPMPYSFVLLQQFAAKRKHVMAPQIIEKILFFDGSKKLFTFLNSILYKHLLKILS
ncbi:hypothetical protein IB49_17310 [Geobacillus sp. LC300]|nr:hypothetical protein IB49_17310 [Geobacillus sp. LC300]